MKPGDLVCEVNAATVSSSDMNIESMKLPESCRYPVCCRLECGICVNTEKIGIK